MPTGTGHAPDSNTATTTTMPDVTYPVSRTTAELLSAYGTTYAEQAWAAGVILGAAARHPMSSMKQGMNPQNKRLPNAAIVTTNTLTKGIYGQTANFQVRAPLGGFGTQGAGGYRDGHGEQFKDKMFTLTTGVHHHSVQLNNVSTAQTRIGVGSSDRAVQESCRELFGWLSGNLLEAETIRATALAASRCVLYANGKTAVNELTSNDILTTEEVSRMKDQLQENMAQPFSITTDGVSDVNEFLVMAPSQLWRPMKASDEWKSLLQLADNRGKGNHLFGGGMPTWDACKLFDWQLQASDADGPIGAFAQPMALLGEVIAAGTTAFTIKGGGNATAAALTDRAYFFNFSGTGVRLFEQTKITRTTDQTYYILAKGAGKTWAMASYKQTSEGDLDDATGTVAPGNRLTTFQFLAAAAAGDAVTTLGDVTWDTGVWADCHCAWSDLAVGAKIYQCNSKGQTYGWATGFGQHAVMDGHGRIKADGSAGYGERTESTATDMGRLKALGMVMSYGANAYVDTNGVPRGLVRMAAAFNPPGLPTIV